MMIITFSIGIALDIIICAIYYYRFFFGNRCHSNKVNPTCENGDCKTRYTAKK